MLAKVISGGQNGVDYAALVAALYCEIPTGGAMPPDWMTLDGPRPQENVWASHATLQIAKDLKSPGEVCTLNAVQIYNRPFIRIQLSRPTNAFRIVNYPNESDAIQAILAMIREEKVTILNVAGNSEKTAPHITHFATAFLIKLFQKVQGG